MVMDQIWGNTDDGSDPLFGLFDDSTLQNQSINSLVTAQSTQLKVTPTNVVQASLVTGSPQQVVQVQQPHGSPLTQVTPGSLTQVQLQGSPVIYQQAVQSNIRSPANRQHLQIRPKPSPSTPNMKQQAVTNNPVIQIGGGNAANIVVPSASGQAVSLQHIQPAQATTVQQIQAGSKLQMPATIQLANSGTTIQGQGNTNIQIKPPQLNLQGTIIQTSQGNRILIQSQPTQVNVQQFVLQQGAQKSNNVQFVTNSNTNAILPNNLMQNQNVLKTSVVGGANSVLNTQANPQGQQIVLQQGAQPGQFVVQQPSQQASNSNIIVKPNTVHYQPQTTIVNIPAPVQGQGQPLHITQPNMVTMTVASSNSTQGQQTQHALATQQVIATPQTGTTKPIATNSSGVVTLNIGGKLINVPIQQLQNIKNLSQGQPTTVVSSTEAQPRLQMVQTAKQVSSLPQVAGTQVKATQQSQPNILLQGTRGGVAPTGNSSTVSVNNSTVNLNNSTASVNNGTVNLNNSTVSVNNGTVNLNNSNAINSQMLLNNSSNQRIQTPAASNQPAFVQQTFKMEPQKQLNPGIIPQNLMTLVTESHQPPQGLYNQKPITIPSVGAPNKNITVSSAIQHNDISSTQEQSKVLLPQSTTAGTIQYRPIVTMTTTSSSSPTPNHVQNSQSQPQQQQIIPQAVNIKTVQNSEAARQYISQNLPQTTKRSSMTLQEAISKVELELASLNRVITKTKHQETTHAQLVNMHKQLMLKKQVVLAQQHQQQVGKVLTQQQLLNPQQQLNQQQQQLNQSSQQQQLNQSAQQQQLNQAVQQQLNQQTQQLNQQTQQTNQSTSQMNQQTQQLSQNTLQLNQQTQQTQQMNQQQQILSQSQSGLINQQASNSASQVSLVGSKPSFPTGIQSGLPSNSLPKPVKLTQPNGHVDSPPQIVKIIKPSSVGASQNSMSDISAVNTPPQQMRPVTMATTTTPNYYQVITTTNSPMANTLASNGTVQVAPGLTNTVPVVANAASVASNAVPVASNAVSSAANVAPTATQIRVGNQVLNVNMTQENKEKLEAKLAALSPEQQQMFIKHQQLLALRQQQKRVQSIQPKIPLTVQQVQVGSTASKQIVIQTPGTGGVISRIQRAPGLPQVVTKAGLLKQYLQKDQLNVYKQDNKTPFKHYKDACKRLLKFHVWQGNEPGEEEFKKADEALEEVGQSLLKKKQSMFDKYQKLLYDDAMREQISSEGVMIQRLQLSDEKTIFEEEQKLVKEDPDQFKPFLFKKQEKHESVSSVESESKHKPDNLADLLSDSHSDIVEVPPTSINQHIKTEPEIKQIKTEPEIKQEMKDVKVKTEQGIKTESEIEIANEEVIIKTESSSDSNVDEDIDDYAPLVRTLKTESGGTMKLIIKNSPRPHSPAPDIKAEHVNVEANEIVEDEPTKKTDRPVSVLSSSSDSLDNTPLDKRLHLKRKLSTDSESNSVSAGSEHELPDKRKTESDIAVEGLLSMVLPPEQEVVEEEVVIEEPGEVPFTEFQEDQQAIGSITNDSSDFFNNDIVFDREYNQTDLYHHDHRTNSSDLITTNLDNLDDETPHVGQDVHTEHIEIDSEDSESDSDDSNVNDTDMLSEQVVDQQDGQDGGSLNEQVQSAIDSILSLQNFTGGTGHPSITENPNDLDPSMLDLQHFATQPHFDEVQNETDFTSQPQIEIGQDSTVDEEHGIEDEQDMAIQSILM